MLGFPPISGITQSVSSPVPETVTCAYGLRMLQERDNKPLSVYRGGARTEEPVCYLTGKFVTLCEDVQAARSRTASFQEKERRNGNSPPLGSCPQKREEKKRKESRLLLDRYKHCAVSLNEERVRVSIFAPLQSMAAHSYLLWSECR